MNGTIQAATLPQHTWPALAHAAGAARRVRSSITLDGEEYLAFANPLGPPGPRGQPMGIVLRSQTERLRFLNAAAHAARRDRRRRGVPRHAVQLRDRAHGDPAGRGDHLDDAGDGGERRPVAPDPGAPDARWQDEDARLLATTFNSMTDSIERFQREATQRERLSSLGRLSTVVAHEIRNPLMIIKTSLRALRREDARAGTGAGRGAATSTRRSRRLNRIVAEVLDFARPIKFDLGAGRSERAGAGRRARGGSGGRLHRRSALTLDPDDPGARTSTPSGCARRS